MCFDAKGGPVTVKLFKRGLFEEKPKLKGFMRDL